MSRKSEYKKIGTIEFTWHYIVMSGILMAVLALYVDIYPYRSDWYLLISIPIGLLGFLNFIWLYKKPNLYAKFFNLVNLSIMFALVASRCFSNFLPEFSFTIHALILLTVLTSHTLHIWNFRAFNFIRNELWAPRTWWAKLFFKAMIILGSIGLPLTLTLSHYGKSNISIAFFGTLSLISSIGTAFSKAPVSPWEKLSVA